MDSYFSLVNVVAAAISFFALLGTIFFLFRNRKSRSFQENKKVASSRNRKYETIDQSRHIDTDQPVVEAPPHIAINDIVIMSPIGTTDLPADNTSSQPEPSKYHVFPSFHGTDVRKNILSHLHKEFKSKGIDAFNDNGMERGKSIGPELKEAIGGSRVAIVLLSKNYASSTWCLSELVEIMESREKPDQTVIPIFYEVDPTDVKKQTGDFGQVFKKTCEGKTEEVIGRWKHALTKVAQITGFHSTNWLMYIWSLIGRFGSIWSNFVLYRDFTEFNGCVCSVRRSVHPLFQNSARGKSAFLEKYNFSPNFFQIYKRPKIVFRLLY